MPATFVTTNPGGDQLGSSSAGTKVLWVSSLSPREPGGGPGVEGPGVAGSPPSMSLRPLAAVACHINGGSAGALGGGGGGPFSPPRTRGRSLGASSLRLRRVGCGGRVGKPQAGEEGTPRCGWHVRVN